MIVRVLGVNDSKSRPEVIYIAGVGACQVVDEDARLTSATQLTTWLQAARTAAQATSLLGIPRLNRVAQSPDAHVYLALDATGKVAAQITAT